MFESKSFNTYFFGFIGLVILAASVYLSVRDFNQEQAALDQQTVAAATKDAPLKVGKDIYINSLRSFVMDSSKGVYGFSATIGCSARLAQQSGFAVNATYNINFGNGGRQNSTMAIACSGGEYGYWYTTYSRPGTYNIGMQMTISGWSGASSKSLRLNVKADCSNQPCSYTGQTKCASPDRYQKCVKDAATGCYKWAAVSTACPVVAGNKWVCNYTTGQCQAR